MARPRSKTPAPARAPAGGALADGREEDGTAPVQREDEAERQERLRKHRQYQLRYREKKTRKRLAARRRRIAGRNRPPGRDCAWAAGHFEGEGTVSLMSSRSSCVSFTLVNLSSTDRNVVDFFQATWPGRIDTFRPKTARSREIYRWALYGQDPIECFLLDMRPHLKTPRVRRKVALLLHDIRERVHLRRTDADRAAKRARMALMRELNRRGVPPGEEA